MIFNLWSWPRHWYLDCMVKIYHINLYHLLGSCILLSTLFLPSTRLCYGRNAITSNIFIQTLESYWMLEKSTLSVKKVLPFTERVFSQPYIQLKILTISFTLSKQVFQKIHFKFFFIYIHLYMVHFTKDRYAHKNNDKNLC